MSDADTFVTSYMVDDDILVLKLHGRFDDKTAPEFDAEVEKRFAEGAHKVIIDCSFFLKKLVKYVDLLSFQSISI